MSEFVTHIIHEHDQCHCFKPLSVGAGGFAEAPGRISENSARPAKEFVLVFTNLSAATVFWLESYVIQPIYLRKTILTA